METFVLIKPDAVERGLIHEVIGRIEKKGLKIVKMQLIELGRNAAGSLYHKFRDRDFFEALLTFMTTGPSIAMILTHPHERGVVAVVRKLVGSFEHGYQNLEVALPGTIRGDLAENYRRNVVHASDSPENALREIRIFFPGYLGP